MNSRPSNSGPPRESDERISASSISVQNSGEPIKLSNVGISGFAAEHGRPGQTIRVWTRGSLTSDQSEFHVLAKAASSLLVGHAHNAGSSINMENHNSILLVIHADQSAELFLDTAAVALEMLAKREVKAGTAIFANDIADIRGMRFPAISLLPADKVLYCFRVDWKFGLFFDFGEERALDVPSMERDLGRLYRNLRYQHVYEALGNEQIFERLIKAGWFPFVEVINLDFHHLLQASLADADLAPIETKILEKFTDAAIDQISTKWFRSHIFAKRRQVIQSAIDAFKRKDPVACLKILLTEIEGIVRDAHIASVGSSAKINDLLDFAFAEGMKKTGGEATLLFPEQFARYLRGFTFANFDPMNPSTAHVSRHSVGHGSADAQAYTQIRALQALLTIDQLSFFL